ncbi:glycine cleavage system aminomethyltransferase GcvT [Haloferax sp. DFSO60]|uniref:glycine cleavage system aminomethyltransferase GcvT n=1 Tax=Haloferax sp. DFSO60 TaxID=3388652 RepID=UPI00397CB91A
MGLRKPPLHSVHDSLGAKSTAFGGWDMPVEYDSIKAEHAAVREEVGIFDVSHMSEIEVSGPDATALMQRLTTNDVTALEPGDSQYAAITTDEGIIIDDTVVYRLPDREHPVYLFIPNAGHDEEMYDRWTSFRDQWGLDATVEDVTEEWAMFAVQGPDALETVSETTDADLGDLSKFQATFADVAGIECWVARTGYTGEDGFEILCPWDDAETVWESLDATPCGLGCRDTLRLEMGYLLSGEDFDPEEQPRTPYEAGIGFVVKLDTEFVGRDALERQKEEGLAEKFVGFTLLDRGIPRHGYDIANENGDVIGVVTSGTMSPTLSEPIGLGYVPVEYADSDTTVTILVRGREKRAQIVTPPFIDQ